MFTSPETQEIPYESYTTGPPLPTTPEDWDAIRKNAFTMGGMGLGAMAGSGGTGEGNFLPMAGGAVGGGLAGRYLLPNLLEQSL